jgi:pSer/pThr/pTyr-binding forkhead associated (FHA) protein
VEVEVGLVGNELVFGRAAGAGIELPFPTVSARHARLSRTEGGFGIEDLGSSNGTRLGERRLRPGVREALAVGETVGLGGVAVTFTAEIPAGSDVSPSAGTQTLARRLVHDVFATCRPAEQARLAVLSGPERGRDLIFAASRVFTLGRGEGCDWVIADDDVSREHAAFEATDVGITVRDLGSKNGVEVNGEAVVGARVVRDGDVVRVGETRLRLADPEDRYLRQMQQPDGPAGDASRAAHATLPEGSEGVIFSTRPSRLPLVASVVAAAALAVVGVVLALALTL